MFIFSIYIIYRYIYILYIYLFLYFIYMYIYISPIGFVSLGLDLRVCESEILIYIAKMFAPEVVLFATDQPQFGMFVSSEIGW